MNFHIVTIFPEIFNSYFNESILKRSQTNKIIDIKIHNLRDWTEDKHKTVDDTPYGGGAGMVMKIEPLYKAIQSIAPFTRPVYCGDKGARLPLRGTNGQGKGDFSGIKKYRVPKVLLSGDHRKIEEWRRKKMKKVK